MDRALGEAAVNILLGLEKRDLSGLGGYFVDTQSHGTSRFQCGPIITRRRARSNTVICGLVGGFPRLQPAPAAPLPLRYGGNPPPAHKHHIAACGRSTRFAR